MSRGPKTSADKPPNVLVFTPTWGDRLAAETVDSVTALEFSGAFTHEIGRHNPFPDGDWRNVTAQYIQAREQFLARDYDALLTVEHDMVVPPHALQTLWDCDADVAYGVYRLGMGLTLNARGLDGHLCRDHVGVERMDALGVGLGCTLIRRSVLERIAFRPDAHTGTCDEPFAADCIAMGVRQIACFDVACGHLRGDLILLPYSDAETGLLQACMRH